MQSSRLQLCAEDPAAQTNHPITIILMALLGAEEFSFGTAALIVLGCVMMPKNSLIGCAIC